jgi:uncharacterized protein YceH (UPF0502 family)
VALTIINTGYKIALSAATWAAAPAIGKQARLCYHSGILRRSFVMTTEPSASPPASEHRWRPLGAIDRRVAGVLAEKAKTTPDIYPMSLNAVCTGCNQKSNRAPLMQLETSDVEESLDRLRALGAVGLVEGYGRVAKYRHYLYEWLGVDKVELAVMTELLLRGDQTVGELRGRAARMEPIADLAALQPVLDSLKAKGLVVSLTPEGRGHVVTHALYQPRELETLQAKYQGGGPVAAAREEDREAPPPGRAAPPPMGAKLSAPAIAPAGASDAGIAAALRQALADLRQQFAQLRGDLDELRDGQQRLAEEVRTLRDALGG